MFQRKGTLFLLIFEGVFAIIMTEIQKGDIEGRKSYGKDVIFIVKNIFETKKGKITNLRGITEREEADYNQSEFRCY